MRNYSRLQVRNYHRLSSFQKTSKICTLSQSRYSNIKISSNLSSLKENNKANSMNTMLERSSNRFQKPSNSFITMILFMVIFDQKISFAIVNQMGHSLSSWCAILETKRKNISINLFTRHQSCLKGNYKIKRKIFGKLD